MTEKEYFVGLDMGTNSVGWAVTDEHYNLFRIKGKDTWGIREFDEAESSAARRSFRVSRRRRQREQVRLGMVKEYFFNDITNLDSNFFARLENSKYFLEDKDKNAKTPDIVFHDKNYTDKDYYKQYPTIYHLRKELIYNDKQYDIRLVYLAIANLFKHRGHFLNASLSSETGLSDSQGAYNDLCELCKAINIFMPEEFDTKIMDEILSSREYSRSKKAELLSAEMAIGKSNKKEMFIVKLLCGLKVDLNALFENIVDFGENKVSLSLADGGYDEKIIELGDVLGEDNASLIEIAKQIYDMELLTNLMKGYKYLSDARCDAYEKHKKDLNCLKKVIRTYGTKTMYDDFFRKEEEGSYSAYVNSVNSCVDGKKRRNMKGRDRDSLYKKIKTILKDMPSEDEEVRYIFEEIDKETFLPKQLSASNGVIPNQLHIIELKAILQNQEKYHSFLKEKDEYGLSVTERIIQLFAFHIPYYIGPTSEQSEKNKGNGWVVRKEEGKVYPWNIDQKIDVKETSARFIERMVRRCTYFDDSMVLPKASLLYEKFCVLNEINNIRVYGEKISVDLKQKIFCDLFKKRNKVSRSILEKYLIGEGIVNKDDAKTCITGIDTEIHSWLGSYSKFHTLFGDLIETDEYQKLTEQIIYWATIYGDDKKFLKEQLRSKYADKLSENQIKRIVGMKFNDWGRMSREFLEMEGADKETGEVRSLIEMLWEKNDNLMELMREDAYTYLEELKKKTNKAEKSLADFEFEDMEAYYFPAPVKRMVWQTILILKEITKFMEKQPKQIFIEMTRSEDKIKQRKDSRKTQFLALYSKIKEEGNWKQIIENADKDGSLQSKKMYLYLTQLGRCMYTGERIELSQLFDDNIYDIDHIYPRHFVKDDNIANNLVLVKKEKNAHKSDKFPIEGEIYEKMKGFWRELADKNLITKEKCARLMNRQPFTDEQKAGFIARQLVETSQGTKGVADILKMVLPETTLVYAKAGNVSDFRNKFNIPKCREVNDFHHAHDAYLNIVVGNVYYTKFTQNAMNFIKEYNKDTVKNAYNLGRMFETDVIRGNRVAWIAPKKNESQSGTISVVKRVLNKNTALLTRMSLEGHGGIADQTLYGAEKASGQNYIPLKSSDERMCHVEKYGGFAKASTAYFALVEYTSKKKRIRTIEAIPLYLKDKIEKDADELERYCIAALKMENPKVLIRKIKLQSLFRINGYELFITGKTGNRLTTKNAVELCLKTEWISYIKKLVKGASDSIKKDQNIALYDILIKKHTDGIYRNRPNPVGEKLVNRKDLFAALSLEDQREVLIELLKLSAIGVTKANLTKIKESANTGVSLISKNITGNRECKLIYQSVTGIYEKTVDLLTL